MKPVAFDYVRARSLDEASEMLAAWDGAARLLAGGQSLGPMLNLRLARPMRLVDIKRAAGLRELEADGDVMSIGAGFTHAEIEDGVVEDPARGMLRHVARGIAYRAVRNRGTFGGSLAHADPASDWVSTLVALGGTVVARRAGGATRRIAGADFVLGAFATALAQDEVLAAVEVPRLSATARWSYRKVCRKTGEFASAIGIAVADPARGVARLVAGAVEAAPVLLPRSAARLLEAGPEAAASLVADEVAAALPQLDRAALRLHAVAVCHALRGLSEDR